MSNKAHIADSALPPGIIAKKARLIEDTLEHHRKLPERDQDAAWMKWAKGRLCSLREELKHRQPQPH